MGMKRIFQKELNVAQMSFCLSSSCCMFFADFFFFTFNWNDTVGSRISIYSLKSIENIDNANCTPKSNTVETSITSIYSEFVCKQNRRIAVDDISHLHTSSSIQRILLTQRLWASWRLTVLSKVNVASWCSNSAVSFWYRSRITLLHFKSTTIHFIALIKHHL